MKKKNLINERQISFRNIGKTHTHTQKPKQGYCYNAMFIYNYMYIYIKFYLLLFHLLFTLFIYYIYFFNIYMYKKHSHQNFCFRGLKKANLKYNLHKCVFFPELQNMKIESVASVLYINYYRMP